MKGPAIVLSPLTFGSVQLVPRALTPACRVDVGGVGVHPEVVTVGVAVKVQPQPVTADLQRTRGETAKRAGGHDSCQLSER